MYGHFILTWKAKLELTKNTGSETKWKIYKYLDGLKIYIPKRPKLKKPTRIDLNPKKIDPNILVSIRIDYENMNIQNSNIISSILYILIYSLVEIYFIIIL